MSTVKELVPSPDGTAAAPLAAALDEVAADAEVDAGADADEDDDEDDEDDEQPAATTAATAARATQPSRGRGLNVPWPRLYRCIAIAAPPLGFDGWFR
jgi:hypothetical protein